ncbi:hypothetical protein [Streptomyces sp. NPDC050145]|uniref:hypothetical protein n=1 Tax=Streptomyces sp. NPDC050145 TaxID=3365602 RepID=UPI0037899B7A
MTWQDVDPGRHPFDPDQALETVRAVIGAPDPESGRPRGLWSDNSVARGLAEHYGTWAFGWFTATDEYPDSGAVIRQLPPSGLGSGDLDQQAVRYTEALLQWRAWLEELAATFAPFIPAPGADSGTVRRLRESAIAPLVTLVVQRTDAGETWRGACNTALLWFLESTGMPSAEAEELADDIVDGEFESWTAPDQTAIDHARNAIGNHCA